MKRASTCVLILGAALLLPPAASGASAYAPGKGRRILPDRLEEALAALQAHGRIDLERDSLLLHKDLQDFYRNRGQKAAWIVHGVPGKQAGQLLQAVKQSHQDGLDPDDYHAAALEAWLRLYTLKVTRRTRWESRADVELDLLLSDAFLRLGHHLLTGRIHPWTLSDQWHISPEKADLPRLLETALAEGADLRESLRSLAPPQPEYAAMKSWLQEYRKLFLAGGWPEVPAGPPLGPGSREERVAILCRRLQAGGDMPREPCPDSVSRAVEAGVRRFQARHGLDTTGVADAAVLAQLNVSVAQRITQIKLNLECWRWLPQDLGKRHLRVNLADFRLGAYDDQQVALSLKVVIGRTEDRTPVFSDRMTALALNPPWNVPPSIAREEILPELRRDPGYLDRHDMELLSGWSGDAIAIPPASVDWSGVTKGNFSFRVRQKPGASSALGRIKFVLTNPFHIYLHDTPAAAYFRRHERAFSHGCVRVENSLDLAVWALGNASPWDRERLRKEIATGRQTYLPLSGRGIPVHILYWTAFADSHGALHFRRDVYRWDRLLENALRDEEIVF